MDRMLRNKWMIGLFVLPAFLIYSFVVPIPIFKSLYYSFFDWNLLSAMRFIGLDNYVRLFTSDFIFITALKNTFIFAFGCLILQLPLGFWLAYILSGKMKGSQFFRNSYFLPVVISGTSIGLLWQFIYDADNGLINTIVRLLGFSGFSKEWLSDPNFAIYGIIISVSWQFFGYHMIIYLAGITTISNEVIESARMDGATGRTIITRIVIPLVKPFIVVSLILALTGSVKAFDNVVSLTGGGPAHSSEVLALHMYNVAFHEMRYGYGNAIAVILFLLNIGFTLLVLLLQRNNANQGEGA
jgi:raffinose/stachyose/melibiose transport system permease protein